MGFRKYWRRNEEDGELRREMEAHIAHEADENVARGMVEEEARRKARIKFGSETTAREEVWEWNGVALVDGLLRDLRYVGRSLRRAPGFAVAVILVMALGIGSVTAMFTIVRSVLLKPLPFGDAKRLLMVYEYSYDGTQHYNWVAGGMFGEWQKGAKSFEQMALFEAEEYSFSGGRQLPERMIVTICSWRLFPALGVEAALGRRFDANDDRMGASGTAILSWGLWKRRFGGDPGIVGKTVQLEAKPYTVIGVMPAWFAFPAARTQAWLPAYHEIDAMGMEAVDNHQFHVVGLLKAGASAAQGLSEVDTIEKRVHAEFPNKTVGQGASVRPLIEAVVGDYKTPLLVLLAATGCVLVIGCLNVANLFVARCAARKKEIAIRSALGGSRKRLVWEQIVESLALSAVGGIAGTELAYGAVRWVAHARPDMARAEAITMDGTAIAFAAGMIVLGGVFAGAIAALSSSKEQVTESLRDVSRTHTGGQSKARLRKGLLCAEMGLTVILLIGAGLLLKSYRVLRTTDLGCATENVLTLHFALPEEKYRSEAQRLNFFERLATGLRILPGVEKAGLVTRAPGTGYGGDNIFTIPEHPPLRPGQFLDGIRRFADPGYFEAMGIPLLQGRTFREGERLENAKVVIISELLAREYFAGEDAIGRHVRVNAIGMKMQDYEIVGVVGNTRHYVSDPSEPTIYYPLYSGAPNLVFVVARARGEAGSIALPIQKLIASMDADLAVSDVLTMEQVIGQSTMDASFNAELTLGFAVLSLVLASVGLYGVLAYLVAQRTSEMGVRMALGAQRGEVLRLTLVDGMGPVVAGLLAGLAGGAAAARLIRDLLYGVGPWDPGVFAGVAVVLLGVACVACLLPAWKASRLDPVQALRVE